MDELSRGLGPPWPKKKGIYNTQNPSPPLPPPAPPPNKKSILPRPIAQPNPKKIKKLINP